MSKCYVTLKGEAVNVRQVQGTRITEFAIKIDTQDYQTKEWTTSFLNGKLINDKTIEPKKIYEFSGNLDSNVYTNKQGEEVNKIVLTAFHANEVEFDKAPQKEEKPKKKEIPADDLPF